MSRLHPVILGLTVLVISRPVGFAHAQPASDTRAWENTTDFSLVFTDGNTETTTLSVSNEFTYGWASSTLEVRGFATRTRTSTRQLFNVDGELRVDERQETTAESYSARTRYRHRLAGRFLLYTGAGWERDRFAGIEDRYTVNLGAGYDFLKGERMSVVGELGADYTDEGRVGGAGESYVGVQAIIRFERQISPTARVNSEAEIMENLEDTGDLRVNWSNAVTADLTRILALRLVYKLAFDREPVRLPVESETPGVPVAFFEFEELDTRLAAALVVDL